MGGGGVIKKETTGVGKLISLSNKIVQVHNMGENETKLLSNYWSKLIFFFAPVSHVRNDTIDISCWVSISNGSQKISRNLIKPICPHECYCIASTFPLNSRGSGTQVICSPFNKYCTPTVHLLWPWVSHQDGQAPTSKEGAFTFLLPVSSWIECYLSKPRRHENIHRFICEFHRKHGLS